LDQTSLATYNDQQKSVIVEGLVVSEPDMRDTYTSLRVEADHLFISNFPDPHRKRRCSPAFCWATTPASPRASRMRFARRARRTSSPSAARCKTKPDVAFALTVSLIDT
jgi:hypothetical protein